MLGPHATVTDAFGVGPILAVTNAGDSATATAPIEAASETRVAHRLNPRGSRRLNQALHIAAVTQITHDTPGRAYFERTLAEGKTRTEALRALKRRLSDAVYRQLLADPRR